MIKGNIRLLAAIMFTDMVGYTAMMQEDEIKAKALRDRHRDILEKKVGEHQGTILQYYGDGTLSMFGSAIEAVLCAIEVQKVMLREPKIPLRIGVHLGDIVYEDEGAYGDGVNIASRVESLGVPGSVLVSDKVCDEIHNHPSIRAKSLGKFELKNVRRPIEIFAIQSEGLVLPSEEDVRAKVGISYKSIAVLPFVNMSPDKDNEYFSDGITEELLNALSKVEGLKVTSRTSSFVFKNKHQDIREIGKQLNVTTVLEGSVRKAGNRVRITAQLINTSDGYHIWSETYDRNLEDIFEVQDEISKKIAMKMREKLARNQLHEPIVKSYTKNIYAYNEHLKGLHYWNKWVPDEIKKSIQHFEKAIQLDPDFPLPYAALSGCYAYLGATGYLKSEASYPKAKQLAEKAIELDDNIADSHNSIAMVKLFYEWDWEGAEKAFQRSIELNPNSADTHHYYHLYLMAMDRKDDMIKEIEKAHILDPLSPPISASLASAYSIVGRLDEAEEQYKKTLKQDPTFRAALNGLGWIEVQRGNLQKALEIFKDSQQQTADVLKGITPLGYVYGLMGEYEKAQECIEKLLKRQQLESEKSLNIDIAVVYAGMNNYDKVFEYLDKAYEERAGGILFLRNPNWGGLHKDRRFRTLEKKLGWKPTVPA